MDGENSFAITPELLLRHTDFMRSLARSLLFDDNTVDDVVQEAWLVAMQQPPRDKRSLQSWLSTVVRNLVFQNHRRAVRQEKRNRVVARTESIPSTEEILSRESARRQVVEAVLGLNEKYRTVILFHYFDEQSPREISQQLELPLETVRTRLKRGIEQLRIQLDQQHGGRRRAWSLGLIPLALPKAKMGLLSSVGVSALVASVILVVGGIFFFSYSTSETPEIASVSQEKFVVDSNKETLSSVQQLPVELGSRSPNIPETGNTVSTPPVSAVTQEVKTATLYGQVTFEENSNPSSQFRVVLIQSDLLRTPATKPEETITDENGHYQFKDVKEGVYALSVPSQNGYGLQIAPYIVIGKAGMESFDKMNTRFKDTQLSNKIQPSTVLEPGHRAEFNFRLIRGWTIEGTVQGTDGELIADAEILCTPAGFIISDKAISQDPSKIFSMLSQNPALGFQKTFSDTNGRFRIDGLTKPGLLLARARGYLSSNQKIETPYGASAQTQFILKRVPFTWTVRGRVVDSENQGLAGVDLYLLEDTSQWNISRDFKNLEQYIRHNKVPKIQSLADGRFSFDEIPGLMESTWSRESEQQNSMLVIYAVGKQGATLSKSFSAKSLVENLEIKIESSGDLRGQIVDEQGNGIGGAKVLVISKAFARDSYIQLSDHRGVFSFSSIPFGEWRLSASKEGYEDAKRAITFTKEQESVVNEIRLKPAVSSIRGKILALDGKPVPEKIAAGENGPVFSYFSIVASTDPSLIQAKTFGLGTNKGRYNSTDGSFEIDLKTDWENKEIYVGLCVPGLPPMIQQVKKEAELVFHLDPEAVKKNLCFITVKAVDQSTGLPIKEAAVLNVTLFTKPEGKKVIPVTYTQSNEVGTRTIVVSTEGVYDLLVSAKEHGSIWIKNVKITQGAALPPFEVSLSDEGKIYGKIVTQDEDLSKFPNLIKVVDESGVCVQLVEVRPDNSFEIFGLAEGKYQLSYTTVPKYAKVVTWTASVYAIRGARIEARFSPSPPK